MDCQVKSNKTLCLLHGLGGTSSDWLRYTMIEVYAREKGIFVVCPSAECGFYTDCPEGELWETRIMTDIWNYLHNLFPMMSEKREDNFVAGLSMGGYGAMRYALTHPDKFCFGASLSGGLNVPRKFAAGENINGCLQYAFGPPEKVAGSDYDLYVVAENLKNSGNALPKLYIACGTKDWEYEPNREFRDYLEGLGFSIGWDEADYSHEWLFWDEQVEKLLAMLIPGYYVIHKRR